MKPFIYFSLLLCVLQVRCHHVPGHQNDPDRIIFEDEHPPLEEERKKTTYAHKITPSNANFAFRFHKLIASLAPDDNIFFSPLSVATAFVLLTLGAKSETESQIYKGLAFNLSEIEKHEIHKGFHQLLHTLNEPNNKAQVDIGNALFIDETLKILPEFLENIKSIYEAEGFSTNFENSAAAKDQINEYVSTKTHGKISQAVDELDQSTVMLLLNYIFFKAVWEDPFNTEDTKEEDFFVNADTTVKVNLMYRNGYYNFLHDEKLSCQVVKVPYKGDAIALFVLPDEGKMQQVEDALATEVLARWKTSFIYEELHLYIPRLSVSTSYNIKELLKKMGVIDVFSDNADLSGITGQRNLKVSQAFHKAVVDIHENGTEAAAVTVVEISPRFGGSSTIVRIDRPFLFLLLDKITQSLLFLGKFMNPAKK